MDLLLSSLLNIPEYMLLTNALSNNESAAVTGIGQLNRSHLIAALHSCVQRPLVVICQDDMAAKRLQEELKAFTGDNFPVLSACGIASTFSTHSLTKSLSLLLLVLIPFLFYLYRYFEWAKRNPSK